MERLIARIITIVFVFQFFTFVNSAQKAFALQDSDAQMEKKLKQELQDSETRERNLTRRYDEESEQINDEKDDEDTESDDLSKEDEALDDSLKNENRDEDEESDENNADEEEKPTENDATADWE